MSAENAETLPSSETQREFWAVTRAPKWNNRSFLKETLHAENQFSEKMQKSYSPTETDTQRETDRQRQSGEKKKKERKKEEKKKGSTLIIKTAADLKYNYSRRVNRSETRTLLNRQRTI